MRAKISTVSLGAYAASRHAGIDRRDAQDQHQLAAVTVPDRTQVQHRGRQAERVADGDQVQRRLRRVEGLADRRQRDVGHREVEVGDRRAQDQRSEDQTGTLWRPARRDPISVHGKPSLVSRLPDTGRRPASEQLPDHAGIRVECPVCRCQQAPQQVSRTASFRAVSADDSDRMSAPTDAIEAADGEVVAADRSDVSEVAAASTASISSEYCVFASLFTVLRSDLTWVRSSCSFDSPDCADLDVLEVVDRGFQRVDTGTHSRLVATTSDQEARQQHDGGQAEREGCQCHTSKLHVESVRRLVPNG